MNEVTLVSFAPIAFDEFVAAMFPPKYYMPPSDGKTPSTLVMSDAYYFMESWVGDDATKFPVVKPAAHLAASLIYDFTNSLLLADGEGKPAVFYLEGKLAPAEVLKNHKDRCTQELELQKSWLIRFIKDGDDLWQKYKQHKMLTDLHRAACKFLNVEREWATELGQTIRCPACNNSVAPTQAICGACRCIINQEAWAKLKFAEGK